MYVAFSLNRIALIGKDHGAIVNFMSKLKIKKYVLVTGFVSIAMPIVKGFKFKINYGNELLSFPIHMELDVWNESGWQRDAYFIANMINDILNYVGFLFVNLGLDVYTLIILLGQ